MPHWWQTFLHINLDIWHYYSQIHCCASSVSLGSDYIVLDNKLWTRFQILLPFPCHQFETLGIITLLSKELYCQAPWPWPWPWPWYLTPNFWQTRAKSWYYNQTDHHPTTNFFLTLAGLTWYLTLSFWQTRAKSWYYIQKDHHPPTHQKLFFYLGQA